MSSPYSNRLTEAEPGAQIYRLLTSGVDDVHRRRTLYAAITT
jgi:hypothetical protein